MRFVLISGLLFGCNSKGTVVLDPEGNIVDDTGVVDDTGDITDTEDTENSDTEDTQDTEDTDDTNGTSDTEDTQDTEDTDPEEPVEIPEDNNNPNVYPNEWDGTRVLNFDGCSETITEEGDEVSQDFPNWMSLCNCDEIYYVQVDTSSACGLQVQTAFYRAVKYNGTEIDILYYPDPNASGPYEPSLLATAVILSDGETWSYEYSAQTASGTATLDGLLTFTEQWYIDEQEFVM